MGVWRHVRGPRAELPDNPDGGSAVRGQRSQKYESVALNFEGSLYAKCHLQMPMVCIFYSLDPLLLN